jgi:hypothetical protein
MKRSATTKTLDLVRDLADVEHLIQSILSTEMSRIAPYQEDWWERRANAVLEQLGEIRRKADQIKFDALGRGPYQDVIDIEIDGRDRFNIACCERPWLGPDGMAGGYFEVELNPSNIPTHACCEVCGQRYILKQGV